MDACLSDRLIECRRVTKTFPTTARAFTALHEVHSAGSVPAHAQTPLGAVGATALENRASRVTRSANAGDERVGAKELEERV